MSRATCPAWRRSVLVRGGRFYALRADDRPPALVIGYAGVRGAELGRGLAGVAAAYRDVTARHETRVDVRRAADSDRRTGLTA
ncbi:hypothetical protein ACFFKH_04210 [Micromonospora marina]|uniref:hypothetical protein n=1 Tax=Micromonospora marina TaxID=307120 RepID=UPI001FC95AAD|nr:hypothetical protein [Micromonospora marina]